VPLVILGLLAVAAGLKEQSAACAALGLSLLALTGLVRGLLAWHSRRLSIACETPEKAFEGDPVEVRFRLTNRAPLPLFFPRLHEIFIPEVHAMKDVLFELRIEPGETAEGGYRGYCVLPRGIYRLGPFLLTLSDPFGWFQVRKRLPIERDLKVYPAMGSYGARLEEGESWSAIVADLTRASVGESTELLAVRDYRRGDPLRRVHWGLTAHRGAPVVREMCREAEGDLIVFVDLYHHALLGLGRGSTIEHSVRLAASLSAHALRQGRRAAVHAGSWVGLGRGGHASGRLDEVLEALIRVRPEGETRLEDILDAAVGRIPAGSVVVIPVSPYLRGSARFRSHLDALRRRDARVIAICYDEESYRRLYEGQNVSCPIDEYIAELRGAGIAAHRASCGMPAEQLFQTVKEQGK
jgi:uncharacterized protein (DUF58 family)